MIKYLTLACMVSLALVAMAAEPQPAQEVSAIQLTEAPAMTPVGPADLQREFDLLPLIAPGGGCGNAGDSCTKDSDCCKDLGCTDNQNQHPNTCQAIAAPAPIDPIEVPRS